jgi:hypothetical protein
MIAGYAAAVLLVASAVAYRLLRRSEWRNAAIAAIGSSALVGPLDTLVGLLAQGGGRGAVWRSLGPGVLAFLVLTILPNLGGMVLVHRLLHSHPEWARRLRLGLVVPAGMVYGEVVMAATILLWMGPLALAVGSVGPFRSASLLFSTTFAYVPAAAGVAALGLYVLLERRALREAA